MSATQSFVPFPLSASPTPGSNTECWLKESRGLSLKPMSASSHSKPCPFLRLRTWAIKSHRQPPLHIYLHFTVHYSSQQWKWIRQGSPGSPTPFFFFWHCQLREYTPADPGYLGILFQRLNSRPWLVHVKRVGREWQVAAIEHWEESKFIWIVTAALLFSVFLIRASNVARRKHPIASQMSWVYEGQTNPSVARHS